jgi:hypothetical protein
MEDIKTNNMDAVTVSKKKTRGCNSCKKKKNEITELPPVNDMDDIFIPTPEDIKLAYAELYNKDIEPHKEYINKVYSFLFNENFDFDCRSCVNAQAIKLKNYIIHTLKLKV